MPQWEPAAAPAPSPSTDRSRRRREGMMVSMNNDHIYYATTPPAAFEGFETYDVRETDFYDRLAQEHPGLILELGCGTGLHVRRLAERGHTVLGLELAPHLVEAARQSA